MKDIVRIKSKIEDYSTKELIFAAAVHFLIFLGGIASTRAVVLNRLLPFGLSYLTAAYGMFLPSAAFGTFCGYFFPLVGNSGFRYIASLFAVISIKLLLSGYKKLVSNPLFLSGISAISCLLTSAVNLKNGESNILDALTETFLCLIGTYFFAKTFALIQSDVSGLSHDELCDILISLCILFMGLNAFSVEGISFGRIFSVTLILIAANHGGITAGAISGIATALCVSLGSIGVNTGVGFAFAGLMAGVFSLLGRYAQITVVILFSFLGAVPSGNLELISRTFIESVLGSAIFMLIPRKTNTLLGKVFSYKTKLNIPQGFKKSLTLRLELASNALRDVSDTVEQVSSQLTKINSPDFNKVISLIEQDACAGCKLRVHCWESKKDSTFEAVMQMTKAVKQGEYSPENFAPVDFRGRCLRLSKIGNAAYRRYSDYASRIAAESRIDEVRSVVSDQFNGISSMLHDLSVDFKNDEQFDSTSAEKAASALKNLGINIEEASARIDKYDRMTLEFKLKKSNDLIINKMQVIRALSVACERDFDVPTVSEVGNDIFIMINEHADIKIDFGAEQICGSKSSMCGDAFKEFYDGKGHFIMVLSDGMGTGGRAAVDGAMASGLMSRLLKSGFGYDCSLKILNSSMLFKSTDESLATLDIASIDLYTGVLELYKAGAAPTIIKRNGKVAKAESTSLPAGILRDISFDRASVKCRVGDIIVLMTDGVSSTGTDWIRAEIEAFNEGTAQTLAERLCECARRRSSDTKADDMTVMVAILERTIY